MTGTGRGCILAGVALTLVLAASAGVRAEDERYFEFRVCNETSRPATVAVSSRYQPGSSDFVVAGWWTVAARGCRSIGHYPRGHFYTYAHASGGGEWGKGDLRLCVEEPGPFKRINLTDYKCDRRLLRPFNHVEVVRSVYEWTLNP
jgi:uncharacterized membrane protein